MADLQLHRRLAVPAGVLAFEEMAEEALLQREAVVGVEMRPMGVAMRLEPFLRRCRAHEAFEIAARVQPCPPQLAADSSGTVISPGRACARGSRRRRADARADACAMSGGCARALRRDSVSGPHASSPVTAAARAALAEPCCTRRTARGTSLSGSCRGCRRDGWARDSSRRRLPTRRSRRGAAAAARRRPLVRRVVGDAVQADLAAAPGLRAGPLDALVESCVSRGDHGSR